ncbi:PLD nuclease N-terminal domain-containing protein [Dehalogenimonas sp. THU2]|uniref:PLD nuclease N-terminal domain-containing protein n=1 Tax=Dehalogenimonas sp. THU2 TaxID=3151121 RepID=UPI0032187D6F
MSDSELQLIKDLLPLLIPVIIIELVLLVIALMDLVKRKRVKGESKVVWALVIIFINLIGPIVYLVWGRHPDAGQEDESNDSGYKN